MGINSSLVFAIWFVLIVFMEVLYESGNLFPFGIASFLCGNMQRNMILALSYI